MSVGFKTSLCVVCVPSCSPVEGVGLCYGPVQTTGGTVTDQLEEMHHTVVSVSGDSQVHALP